MCAESGDNTAASGSGPTSVRVPAGSRRVPVGRRGDVVRVAIEDGDGELQAATTAQMSAVPVRMVRRVKSVMLKHRMPYPCSREMDANVVEL